MTFTSLPSPSVMGQGVDINFLVMVDPHTILLPSKEGAVLEFLNRDLGQIRNIDIKFSNIILYLVMNKPLITANWKLNKTIDETIAFINELIPLVKDNKDVEIVIAPPFTSLYKAYLTLKDSSIKLAAQNVFYADNGAFTGEVSPLMLVDVGCSYVIIGHSERRQYFNETNDIINRKILAARRHNLIVIFCIGESLKEREEGKTFNIVENQLIEGLKDVMSDGIVIAYEPIWAIGTGKTATPQQAQEVHKFIKDWLLSKYGKDANKIRIIYGGSVTPENIDSLMNCEDIDGALVGGASLDAEKFAKIVNFKRRNF